MKISALAAGLAIDQVYANIPFPKKQMSCGDGLASCFRGMPCEAGQ